MAEISYPGDTLRPGKRTRNLEEIEKSYRARAACTFPFLPAAPISFINGLVGSLRAFGDSGGEGMVRMGEPDFLHQALAGSESSLALLMNEYASKLKDHAARYLAGSSPDKTESDVVQETQIRVMEQFRRGEFQGTTIEEFRAYIFKVARNLAINWSRVNRRVRVVPEGQPEAILDAWRRLVTIPPSEQEPPSEAAARREEEDLIERAVKSLRPMHQQIYQLSLQPGITNEQIGRQVGLSAEAVRKTRERMLLLLKRWIRTRMQVRGGVDGSSS